ncbi:uncharacterized protein LOC123192027 [Mangifera indica]|uniref:uncharacterized protein LOC123192027 n=1 Tax=Mangifera indica TaxID=29780 RepID=UPI001CF99ADA|nr:uncharacterized protein LOC123192027 [Mangifera indica]
MEFVMPGRDSFCLRAPTSLKRLNMNRLCFSSVPTSPTTSPLKSFYDVETEPTTPLSYGDANSGFIDFEFDTSCRFKLADDEFETSPTFEMPCMQQEQQQHCQGSSLPAMAFADELFCNGKVMPLKPPPRLQYGNSVENSSTLSSPRSPSGRLKFPFQLRSLWNDDFDPFMVALETVKREERQKTRRRARSMSPLRARSPKKHANCSISSKNHQGIKQLRPNLDGEMELNQKGNMGRQEQGRSIRLAEPKGVLFSRQARIVKTGQQKLGKPSFRNGPEPGETKEGNKEGEGASTRGSKRPKIKKFLLKSASMGRTSNEEKQKDESATLPKRIYTRIFSFKSMKSGQYNEEERVSEMTKMTTIQHRPKLFLCMGHGTSYAD